MGYQYLEGIKVIVNWIVCWMGSIFILAGIVLVGLDILFAIQENKEHMKKARIAKRYKKHVKSREILARMKMVG